MNLAIRNKRYVLSCLDSDGAEKLATPNVINSEILFGPKGAVLQLDHNDWKRIKFILSMDDIVYDTSSIERKSNPFYKRRKYTIIRQS